MRVGFEFTDDEEEPPLSSVLRGWQQATAYAVAASTPAADADRYADLVGIWEIADILGVPKRRVERWIERRAATGCPAPVRRLKMGHLYVMADWRGWYAVWQATRIDTTRHEVDSFMGDLE